MKPTMTPATVEAGAGVASALGAQLATIGSTVSSYSVPVGVESVTSGDLRAVGAAITRAGEAVGSQNAWLLHRAQLFLLADGYGGVLFGAADGGPPLKSPFPPGPPRRSFWQGVGAGLEDVVMGFSKTAVVGGRKLVPGIDRFPKELTPFGKTQRRWEKEFNEGIAAAMRDPGAFAKAFGRDAIAYDEHAAGDTDYAVGKNVVALLGLLVPWSKLSKLGVAARRGHRADINVTVKTQLQNTKQLQQNLARTDWKTAGRRYRDARNSHTASPEALESLKRDFRKSKEAWREAERIATEAARNRARAEAAAQDARARVQAAIVDVHRERPTLMTTQGRKDLAIGATVGGFDPRQGSVPMWESFELMAEDDQKKQGKSR